MADKRKAEPRGVSIMQACAMAGVSRRTIYNWLNAGKLVFVRTAGGAIRINADSLFRDSTDTERTDVSASARS